MSDTTFYKACTVNEFQIHESKEVNIHKLNNKFLKTEF